jgi:hypothetical protein
LQADAQEATMQIQQFQLKEKDLVEKCRDQVRYGVECIEEFA